MKKENLKWLPIIGIPFGVKWFYANESIKTIFWEGYQYLTIVLFAYIFI
jgi:hypothetical protein